MRESDLTNFIETTFGFETINGSSHAFVVSDHCSYLNVTPFAQKNSDRMQVVTPTFESEKSHIVFARPRGDYLTNVAKSVVDFGGDFEAFLV